MHTAARRTWLAHVGLALAGLFGLGLPVTASQPELQHKRAFRRTDQQWLEIAWDEICPGDRIIAVDDAGGRLAGLDVFTAVTGPDGHAGCIYVRDDVNILHNIDHLAVVGRE